MLKKTVVASVALLAAMAAQAQVTAYGVLDASVGRYESLSLKYTSSTDTLTSKKSGLTKVQSGDMTASYLGFKGQEDLGGGLSAVFSLETYIKNDTGAQGTSNFWGRNTVVGLAGGFGTLTAGHADTLLYKEATAFNPFGASLTFSPAVRQALLGFATDVSITVDGTSLLPTLATGWANSLTYVSPNLSGFVGSVQLGLKEDSSQTRGRTGLSGSYTAGPLAVSLAYQQDKLGPVNSTEKLTSVLLSGSYDFGVAKGFAQWGSNKLSEADANFKYLQIGASVPVSAQGAVLASFGQSKADDLKVRDLSIAYNHTLSKRTDAYVGLRNERFSVAGDGENLNAYSVGLRHRF